MKVKAGKGKGRRCVTGSPQGERQCHEIDNFMDLRSFPCSPFSLSAVSCNLLYCHTVDWMRAKARRRRRRNAH